jgi:hypothetical protein
VPPPRQGARSRQAAEAVAHILFVRVDRAPPRRRADRKGEVITGLAVGIAVAWVVGLFVPARFRPGRSRYRETGMAMAIAAVATLAFGHLFGQRGWELVITAAVGPAIIAAPLGGNLVRELVNGRRARTRSD